MKFKLAISLAVFVVVCVVGIFAYIKYNTIDLKSYELLQNLFEEQIFDKEVYVDGKKSMFLNAPIKNENDIYIPVSFVANNLKNNILYDQENGILSIATDFDRIKILNGEKAYYVNGEKTNLSKEAIIEKEKNAFISSELIEKFYNFNFEYAEKYDSYCFESTLTAKKTGSISENDKLYNYKGEPLKILNKTGDKVNVSVSEGDQISIYFEENNLVKIRTSDGVVGFVPKDIISNEKVKEVEEKVKTSEPKVIDKDSNAIILFEQVSNKSANYLATQKEIPKGVDVLVPTWFSFNKTNDGTDGKIISLADENYVKFAHQKGRKVWGLITDNFDTDISRSVVKSAITREKVVNQLTSIVKKYNLDGINIDFENIPNDSMTEFTQFLR